MTCRKFSRGFVQTWVFALLIFAVAPLGIHGVFQLSKLEEKEILSTQILLRHTAIEVREKTQDLFQSAEDLLIGLSGLAAIRSKDHTACSAVLKKIGSRFPKYTNFSKVNVKRFVVCSSGVLKKPINVATSINIQQAFETGRLAISPFKFGILTGKPTVVVSLPLLNTQGKVEGTLNSGLSLVWMEDYLERLALPHEAQITVFSSNGIVFAHHPGKSLAPGDNIVNSPLVELVHTAVPQNTHTVSFLDGEPHLVSITSLQNVSGGAHIAVHIPEKAIRTGPRQELRERLIILGSVLLFSFAIAWLLFRRFLVAPIQRLAITANRMAEGDLAARSGIDHDAGELGFLAASYDRMAEALNNRDEDLRHSLETLTRSNIELERFAYVASHDLQEPIRTIISYSQLLERRCASHLNDDEREYLTFLVGGAQRMQELVSALLAYSRGTMDNARQHTSINVREILEDILTQLQDMINRSNAKITIEDLPNVFGDKMQISMVLQNLLTNAVKYSCSHRKIRINIGGYRDKKENIIYVRDNGIGISTHHYERIFQIFKRLHTNDVYSGTGIGLAICKRIIEQHGGRIWVESKENHGSTFFVALPAKEIKN